MDTEQETEAYAGADQDFIEVPDDFSFTEDGDPGDKGPALDGSEEEIKPEPIVEDEDVVVDDIVEKKEEQKPPKKKDPQKRINQLSGQAKTANEGRIAAEVARDLANARADKAIEELEKLKTDSSTEREEQIIEQRKTAMVDGELEKVIELGDELTEVKMNRLKPKETYQDPLPEKTPVSDEKPVHSSAKSWIEKNDWYNDPANEKLAVAAEKIESDLIQSGMDYDDDFYEELDKRISKHPGYSAVNQLDKVAEGDDPGKPNHITSSERGSVAPAREKAGKLTSYDIRTMKTYGLDPNDPKIRAAYMKRKTGVRK